MSFNLTKAVVALGALTIAGACTQESSVTRNMTYQEIGQERALTQLSRKFMAQAPYTVNFDFDKYDLDAEAHARLDEQATWILAHPEARFSVYGHTDLMGGNAYNQALGLNRAQMVVDYLVSKGVNAGRLEIKMTLGEDMPLVNVVAPNEANRRATTFVSGWISSRAGSDDRSAARGDTPVVIPAIVTTGGPGSCVQGVDCPGDDDDTGGGNPGGNGGDGGNPGGNPGGNGGDGGNPGGNGGDGGNPGGNGGDGGNPGGNGGDGGGDGNPGGNGGGNEDDGAGDEEEDRDTEVRPNRDMEKDKNRKEPKNNKKRD